MWDYFAWNYYEKLFEKRLFFNRKRTEDAEDKYARVAGFREFIKLVEKDKLERLVEDNPNIFFDVLPYAYVLGVFEPVEEYTGKVIAIIHRINDNDDKLIVANKNYTDDQIRALTEFQEAYFESEIWR